MAEEERTLRSLYALRAAEPAGDHLGEDEWVALAVGETVGAARERALEHIVRCGPCAHVYRGLSELEEGARRIDKRVPQVVGPAPLDGLQTTRWAWWGGMAAAAALVWAIAQPRPAMAPAPDPTGSELRGPADGRPALVEPLGAVSGWPERLRWEPVAQARAYRVRILGGEGDELWSSPLLAETSVAWPASIAPRPGRMYWQVAAYPQGGRDADAVASVLASFDYQP
jgi:hypothetical protein